MQLGDDDAAAYSRYLAARRAAPDADPAARARSVTAARNEACDVPLHIAELAAEVAGQASELVAVGNPNLRGDAMTAALLAAAAAHAAALLVAENLNDAPSDPRVAAAAAASRQAQRLVQETSELLR